MSEHDWILNGSGDVFAIFRILGNSNMTMSNASIALGPGGIGNGSESDAPDRLGAIFVHFEEPVNNTDTVLNLGGNVILNGVGFWDLNPFRNGTYDDSVGTVVDISNGQGCSQFIGSKVQHTSSSRFTRCTPEAVIPEPATCWLALLGFGILVLRARR